MKVARRRKKYERERVKERTLKERFDRLSAELHGKKKVRRDR